MPFTPHRLLKLCALTLWLPARILGDDTPPPPSSPTVVEMPPFVVEVEQFGFDRWHKTESEHFVVYSDCDKEEVEENIADAERILAALHKHSGLPYLKLERKVLIYPDSNSDWSKLDAKVSEKNKRIHLRLVSGSISGQVVDLGMVRKAGFLSRTLGHSRADMAIRATTGAEFLRLHNLPYPTWFTRGIQMLAIGAEVHENSVDLGARNKREDRYRRSSYLPWDGFFSQELKGKSIHDILLLDAQAGVLVRYLLANQDPVRKAKTYQYLYYTGEGRLISETDFVNFLGKKPGEWHEKLRKFAKKDPSPVNIPLTDAESKPRIQHPEMRISEIRDLFILAQICRGRLEEPKAVLEHMKGRSNQSELLRSMLATGYITVNDRKGAFQVLTGLISEKSDNPKVYHAAARVLFEDTIGSVGLDARLPEKVETLCTRYCLKALELEPSLKEANVLLGYTLALGETVNKEKLAELERRIQHMATHHFTRDLLLAKALLCSRLDREAEALELCEELLAGKRVRDSVSSLALALGRKLEPGFHADATALAQPLESSEAKPETEVPPEGEPDKPEMEEQPETKKPGN